MDIYFGSWIESSSDNIIIHRKLVTRKLVKIFRPKITERNIFGFWIYLFTFSKNGEHPFLKILFHLDKYFFLFVGFIF